jgi:superfamily II DNA or RNA helicase
MRDISPVFQQIRESADKGLWSKGVALARANQVFQEEMTADEYILRVKEDSRSVSPKVRLWCDEQDWHCDCGSEADPCEHVAGAVIALKLALDKGEDLPKMTVQSGKVNYEFKSQGDQLSFERFIVIDQEKHTFASSLSALVTGRVAGPQVLASKEDLKVDLLLTQFKRGVIPRGIVKLFFDAMAEIDGDVILDGKPVKVSSEYVGVLATVEDRGGGFYIRGEQDPDIKRAYSNGIALCEGNILRWISDGGLTSAELKGLREGVYFGQRETPVLVGEFLPNLRKKIKVVVKSQKIPKVLDLRPRIILDTSQHGSVLAVMPSIVYGDPIVAWIENDEMKMLEHGEIPRRHRDEERRLKEEWMHRYSLPLETMSRFDGEQGVKFVDSLQDWNGEIRGTGAQNFQKSEALQGLFSVNDEDFELSFSNAAGKKADPSQVLEAWQKGRSLVPLIEGGWAELPVNWLEKYGANIQKLMIAKEGRENLPRSCLALLGDVAEDMGVSMPKAVAELREKIARSGEFEEIYLPSDILVELRDYQKLGVNWLGNLKALELGAILADDMGLGKTLQTICILEGKCLVVAPTSVITNWQKEIKSFRPSLRTGLYYGAQREIDFNEVDVVITSYAMLRLDQHVLSGIDWDVLVLDESQVIKNPQSQVAQAAFTLAAKFRICLSGTPVENRLEELWSQMHFANPGLLGGLRDFQEQVVKPVERGDEVASQALQKRIRPFVLRRLKRDVALELPEKTEVVLNVDLSPQERDVYQTILLATKTNILQKLQEGGSVIEALEALLRLRQAACHCGLVPGQDMKSSSKITLLLEQLEKSMDNDHKSLVFSQWTSLLDFIEVELAERGISFLRIDGSTRDRQTIVDQFQEQSEPKVLLMSLKAAGVGLNLTAADHVFIVDPWWNPAVEDQAADRAHRIGQKNAVLVHRLVAVDTVEEKILQLQEKKRALSDAALGQGSSKGGFTMDDLLSLF